MNKKLTFAILSISMITVMASAAVSPALANISRAFPEVGIGMIKTVLTLPSLFIIPFSLVSGHLVHRFGNKHVLMAGIVIYIVGGIAPVFADSITELLVWRAILGCGCGLIMPISQTLIAVNFQGDLKAKITGYSGAASYLMGVIASFVVAPLSSVDWHYSFYIYLVAVMVLVLNIVLLPNDKPQKTEHKAASKTFPRYVWWIILGMLLVNVAFYAVPANVALFMKEQGIGHAQSAGVVISAFMIAGFVSGLILSVLRRWFRTYTVMLGVAIMALGYVILSSAYALMPVVAGSALVGFSFGVLFPSLLILITNKCSGAACILALSFSSCAQFLGQFLSPYVLQGAKDLVGLRSLRGDFTILAVALGVAVFVYLVVKLLLSYHPIHRLSFTSNRNRFRITYWLGEMDADSGDIYHLNFFLGKAQLFKLSRQVVVIKSSTARCRICQKDAFSLK
ncbi:MFS transporter [Bacteroides sp. 51]|uniref:MFS transporter n=1 Tax=Bacteroides sp. 51 TaxID=2302938 RepID=UPI0013D42C29|nr:MFS transporter [Bacteroides sp. 51]